MCRDAVAARPDLPLMETGAPLESILPRMASANAYLGADAVASALATGAPVVVTGRVADPSLFVGPILHALGWGYDDYVRLAQATATGHLLECAGQVTGGYFADPGVKDVAGLARLGFPFADVTDTGEDHHRQVRGLAAGASMPPPAPSSYFTRSTIRRPTSRPTACLT